MSTMNASTSDLQERLIETESGKYNSLQQANSSWNTWTEELKKVCWLAGPMISISFLHYMVQVVALMVVGHLGEVPLSSVGIAISFTNITGFTVIRGLCGGLDTLCGQAYGAKQYNKFGTYVYSAIISLLPICIPISVLWIFMDELLLLTGQAPFISVEARKFSVWLIPGLVASAIYYPLTRFFRCQSLTRPLVLSNLAVLILTAFSCWILVYKMNFGTQAVAFSISLFSWFHVVVLCLYIKYSSTCDRTRVAYSKEALDYVWPFLRFGFPSALMTWSFTKSTTGDLRAFCLVGCLQFFFLTVLLVCGLPFYAKIMSSSIFNLSLNLVSLHSTIPLGLSITTSIRVANELGADNPEAARRSAWVVSCVTSLEAVIFSSILLGCRSVVGYAYSHDQEVVDYVAVMLPILFPTMVSDSVQYIFTGVLKGIGWQRIGAYINVGSFYVVGIPAAVVLGFVFQMKARGLWVGMLVALTIRFILLTLLVVLAKWQKQAIEPREKAAGDNVKNVNDTESAFVGARRQEEANDRIQIEGQ